MNCIVKIDIAKISPNNRKARALNGVLCVKIDVSFISTYLVDDFISIRFYGIYKPLFSFHLLLQLSCRIFAEKILWLNILPYYWKMQ